MSRELIVDLHSILSDYLGRLIDDYSFTALQLNACDIALNRYLEASDDIRLNTIGKVPKEFQLETDVAMHFDKPGLIQQYKYNLPRKIASDYLVRTISIIDAMFEDTFELLLMIYRPDLDEKKRQNFVRSSWSNDNLRNFMISDFGLKKPLSKTLPVEMTFDRYEEYREVRHAIMHNKGKLSKKHKDKLKELKERLPQSLKAKKVSMLDTDMISGNDVTLNYASILNLRKWAYTLLLYLRDCYTETLAGRN